MQPPQCRNFFYVAPLTVEQQQWLGTVHALIDATGAIADSVRVTTETQSLSNRVVGPPALQEILSALHRTIAREKLRAPASISQAFLPVNATFDAFATIAEIVSGAKSSVLFVDPYLDYKVLEYARAVPDDVAVRLLTDGKQCKTDLSPAVAAWHLQFSASRPLEVRLTAKGLLHDRAIFIDGAVAWTLSQSFNKLAARSPAEIVRVDHIAAEKIAAYAAHWMTATPI